MRAILLLTLLFSACASPQVVDIVQPYDEELGCPGLKNEVAELKSS